MLVELGLGVAVVEGVEVVGEMGLVGLGTELVHCAAYLLRDLGGDFDDAHQIALAYILISAL